MALIVVRHRLSRGKGTRRGSVYIYNAPTKLSVWVSLRRRLSLLFRL